MPTSPGRGRSVQSRLGFTLIELLVVVAIISLLVSILLPSLQRARQMAKRSACLANMKGIATTSSVYESDDANGWGVPAHPGQFNQDTQNPTFIGAYEWGGKSGIGRPGFLGGGEDPLNSKYGTRAGFGPSTRPMNLLIYQGGFADYRLGENQEGMRQDTTLELDLFKCPSDDSPPRGGHCEDWVKNSERSSFDHFGNSYAANVFMTGRAGDPMFSNSPYLRPITRVPTPARTIYYEENIGRWAWAARQDDCQIDGLNGIDVGPLKVLPGWHGKDWTYVRSFVDAHAEYQEIIIQGTEDRDGFSRHYRSEHLLTLPEGASWDRFHCIIVRGDGWQKDTLPAPRVETPVIHPGDGIRPSYEDCVNS